MLFSLTDWRVWAIAHSIHEHVHGFVDYKGADAVPAFDPSQSVNPLPRTWEAVSDILNADPTAPTSKDDPVMLADVAGCVGAGMANEFLEFRENYAMLHGFADAALSDPNRVSIDLSNVSACHCMVGSLATRIREQVNGLTDAMLTNLAIVGQRFSDPLGALLCQKMGQKAIARLPSVPQGREFVTKYLRFADMTRGITV
jgi:hypothetical protein